MYDIVFGKEINDKKLIVLWELFNHDTKNEKIKSDFKYSF